MATLSHGPCGAGTMSMAVYARYGKDAETMLPDAIEGMVADEYITDDNGTLMLKGWLPHQDREVGPPGKERGIDMLHVVWVA